MNPTAPLPPMRICESAFNAIVDHIAAKPAETGGALFGHESDMTIRKFIPDVNAATTRTTYTINTEFLNPIVKRLWNEEGLSLIGIIHSHPQGYSTLSAPDRDYFSRFLQTIKRPFFYAPIAHTIPDGGFKLIPYVMDSSGDLIDRTAIEILPDEIPVTAPTPVMDTPSIAAPAPKQGLLPVILRFISSPENVRRLATWEVQALKVLLLAMAGWIVISVTPQLIQFIDQLLQ